MPAFPQPVASSVKGEIAHDAIEIADRLVDQPARLAGIEAQIGFLHDILGMLPAADDAIGVTHQGAAMSHIERQHLAVLAHAILLPLLSDLCDRRASSAAISHR